MIRRCGAVAASGGERVMAAAVFQQGARGSWHLLLRGLRGTGASMW